jgi:hypothetical protein
VNTSKYIPHFSIAAQVRLTEGDHHPRSGQPCSIIRILPNPSKRAEHQWYDVRFEDGYIGRFLEKHLVMTAEEDKVNAA